MFWADIIGRNYVSGTADLGTVKTWVFPAWFENTNPTDSGKFIGFLLSFTHSHYSFIDSTFK